VLSIDSAVGTTAVPVAALTDWLITKSVRAGAVVVALAKVTTRVPLEADVTVIELVAGAAVTVIVAIEVWVVPATVPITV
jgi:hypothetical protein